MLLVLSPGSPNRHSGTQSLFFANPIIVFSPTGPRTSFFALATDMNPGDPPTMFPEIPVWVQFYEVTLDLIWFILIILSLPCQYHFYLKQLFDLVPKYFLCLFHMEDCCHHMVDVDLVCFCSQYKVVDHGGYIYGWDHIVRAVISHVSCTQLLGELEVVIFFSKTILNQILISLFAGFFLLYSQAST